MKTNMYTSCISFEHKLKNFSQFLHMLGKAICDYETLFEIKMYS